MLLIEDFLFNKSICIVLDNFISSDLDERIPHQLCVCVYIYIYSQLATIVIECVEIESSF